MQKAVITIARQYGSGGSVVGQMLAEQLGIDYYDKELLSMVSGERGIDEKALARADEKVRPSLLFGLVKNVYDGEKNTQDLDEAVTSEKLFNYQARLIKAVASEESCVIIGRCADFVLKDHPDVLRVFIHAAEDKRLERAWSIRSDLHLKDVSRYMEKVDKRRGSYYKYFTGQTWTDARNYDLCIDSGKLGFQGCVDTIVQQLKLCLGWDSHVDG
ncbi:MAG: cytidylate kinase-like family protein [Lachnospiraceae bacterium]|nr:cytidylate kinase-like family protein [Lachnospiraceae bacterium]